MKLQKSSLILLTTLALTGCASIGKSIEAPRVHLANVSVLEAGLVEQRYRLRLRVENPNPIAVPIKGLSYAVKFAGTDFASGVTPNSFTVPASGEGFVDVDVSTNLLRSAQQLMNFLSKNPSALDYELTGQVEVGLPFVRPIPFSRSGEVPLTPLKR